MAERYTRLYTAENNLYVEGSPVILSAGALLKDNETGKVLAQLKIKSIAEKRIKAVKVTVASYDTVGKPLNGTAEFEYLDLCAGRDEEFGQKTLIPLPNDSARAFSVTVTEVDFDDNSVWSNAREYTDALPKPVDLAGALEDDELVRQYRIHYGQVDTLPSEVGDLWYCACGTVNHRDEAECHRCTNTLKALLDCNFDALKAERDKRLAEERAAQEAKEAAEKARREAAMKKTKKILSVALPALAVCAAIIVLSVTITRSTRYKKAAELMDAGQYEEAIVLFEKLGDYKDSKSSATRAKRSIKKAEEEAAKEARAAAKEKANADAYAEAEALLASGNKAHAAMKFYSIADYKDAWERSFALWDEIAQRDNVSAGSHHTAGLKTDGSVVAVGNNEVNQCDVSDWTNIVAVFSGYSNTIGLKADGTAVAVGYNEFGQCNVDSWSNIVSVSAGCYHTVGLKSRGTVVTVGSNKYGQRDVDDWSNIVSVSAGGFHTVGLKADGTVVAVGYNEYGQCDVDDWTNIVAVSAGWFHTVGLKADGTVVAVGNNEADQCAVSRWTDIVAVSAGHAHTVGLKSDGSVVAVGRNVESQCDVGNWADIVAVSTVGWHTVGLKSDGTVVAVGYNEYGQCDVSEWSGIKLPEQIKTNAE